MQEITSSAENFKLGDKLKADIIDIITNIENLVKGIISLLKDAKIISEKIYNDICIGIDLAINSIKAIINNLPKQP
ncbi:hypothetical protein [Xenorhabdus bharatensis]|uniref:hypothetical protein n=1 Tax=Xenorhabdus bharatensis TaxID=3136256 RepID=UPI0030F498BA